MPMDQMAAVLDINKATLERMSNREPEIKAAISKGRSEASANVRQTAYDMAVGGKCPAMTIFWLKVREHWKEPKEFHITSDVPFVMAYDQTKKIMAKQQVSVESSNDLGVTDDGEADTDEAG